MKRPWSGDEIRHLKERYEAGDPAEDIAETLNRSLTSVHNKARLMGYRHGANHPERPVFHKPETVNRPASELIEDMARAYRAKSARHETKRQGLTVTMPDDGPYGILFFGDPHLGDDGCDIEHICHDIETVRATPHLYGVCMGDLCNFWIGRLGRLYAHQHTTDDEEIELAEWFLSSIPWLWTVLGNHDKWTTAAELLCKKHNVPYVSHGAKFRLVSGESEFRVDCRHSHKGHSMYNASHAQLKKIWRGSNCHLIIGAHTHQSALTQLANGETGMVGLAVRVGAYKKVDEYADANHMDGDTIAPSVMMVVNPAYEGTPEFIKHFWTVEAGVDYLHHLRQVYSEAS